jgi:hypothetical protein
MTLKMANEVVTLTLHRLTPYTRSDIDHIRASIQPNIHVVLLKLITGCDSDETFQYVLDSFPHIQSLHLCHRIHHPTELLANLPRFKHILYDHVDSREFIHQTLIRLGPTNETWAFQDCSMDNITDFLPHVRQLRTLSLDKCNFDITAIADLFRALPTTQLECLQLKHRFNQVLPISALIKSLPTSRLMKLALWHHFSKEQMTEFLFAVKQSPVVELELVDAHELDQVAEWLRTDNKLEQLILPSESTAWSMMDVRYHPRLREVPATPFHRPLGMVGQRLFVNQSVEVKRFVQLLAQPPVPKDILRHMHEFCRIPNQQWMSIEEVAQQIQQQGAALLAQHPELAALFEQHGMNL